MIEHKVWRGPKWKQGITGQRIAIVGYSHHRDPEHADNNDFTIRVVCKFLNGELARNALFTTVPSYFGYSDHAEFWKSVWFFNFISECIGTGDKKYATAIPNQIERAQRRFLRILQKEEIQKVFVFTTKGWSNCPYTDEEKEDKNCAPLGPDPKDGTWGKYTFGKREVLAFGFRHPQFADKKRMKSAVGRALSKKVGS
jgi:hypothetical protein